MHTCEPRRPHVRRTRAFVLSFSRPRARFCHTVTKNIKLILYLIRAWMPSSLPLWISFCRDNRAILNRHEADNFFPPLRRRETARPRRSPAKIPESIFSNIRSTFDICKLYTYEGCACRANERASEQQRTASRARDRLAREFMKENSANKFNATLI